MSVACAYMNIQILEDWQILTFYPSSSNFPAVAFNEFASLKIVWQIGRMEFSIESCMAGKFTSFYSLDTVIS